MEVEDTTLVEGLLLLSLEEEEEENLASGAKFTDELPTATIFPAWRLDDIEGLESLELNIQQ